MAFNTQSKIPIRSRKSKVSFSSLLFHCEKEISVLSNLRGHLWGKETVVL
jgi:hypothetical protein